MRSWMIAALAGVIILQVCGILLPGYTFCILLMMGIGLLFLPRLVWIGCFVLGITFAHSSLQEQYDVVLPKVLEGVPVIIEGYQCSVSRFMDGVIQYDFCGHLLDQSSVLSPPLIKVRLSEYQIDRYHLRASQLLVKLKRPHGVLNPKAFDYSRWLFANEYTAKGYVKSVLKNEPGSDCALHCWYWGYRLLVIEKIRKWLASYQNNGFLLALLVGEKVDLNKGDWKQLQLGGIQHLVAISGMHLGAISVLLFWLCRQVILHPVIVLSQDCKHLMIALSVTLGTFAYCALAGFPVSCQRAFVMVMFVTWSWYFRRSVSSLQSLLIAALVIVLIEPKQVLLAGFWLSFLAVFALFYGFSNRLQPSKPLKALILAQLVVSLGLMPVISMFDMPFSQYGLFVNLVAIPLVTVFILPISLLALVLYMAAPNLASMLMEVSDYLISLLMSLINTLSDLGESGLYYASLDSWWEICALGLLVLVVFRTLSICSNLLILFIIALFLGGDRAENREGLMVMDVGQGLALVILNGKKATLYDTGPAYGDFNLYEAQIRPFLQSRGFENINLVISHGDRDHTGGLDVALSDFKFANILAGESLRISDQIKKSIGFDKSVGGFLNDNLQRIISCSKYINNSEISGYIEVIYHNEYANTANDRSCVMLFRVSGLNVLVPGDITAKEEEKVAAYLKTQGIWIDVLLVSHHGSRSSSSQAFIDEVNPQLAIVSSGYRNAFHHPHPEILSRFAKKSIKVINTADEGAIFVAVDRQGEVQWQSMRKNSKAIWHHL